MGCTSPLSGFYSGKLTSKGRPALIVANAGIFELPLEKVNGKFYWHCHPVDDSHVSLSKNGYVIPHCYYLPIPCGHCLGCRLDYSRTWAIRCLKESELYKSNYFITLTYSPSKLEHKYLVKKDFQDFMKRLRIAFERKGIKCRCRYFACGEYGEHYSRPHFHAVMFDCPLFDLQPLMRDKRGNLLFKSQFLSSVWGKGFVSVGNITFDSACYVAKYVLKKHKGRDNDKYYAQIGLTPEFVVMSRRPGIAGQFIQEHLGHVYKTGSVVFAKNGKVMSDKPCRFFDNTLGKENPGVFDYVKRVRALSADIASTFDDFVLQQNELKQKALNLKRKNEFAKKGLLDI